MKKFKFLYKAMMDDLKDADMLIDYACELKESEEDKALANEIAKYAQARLDHFMSFHKIFESESAKVKEVSNDTVQGCMWNEAHEMYLSWYEDIEKKIKKFG